MTWQEPNHLSHHYESEGQKSGIEVRPFPMEHEGPRQCFNCLLLEAYLYLTLKKTEAVMRKQSTAQDAPFAFLPHHPLWPSAIL